MLGLIALLGTAVMVGARYRSRSEASFAVSERAAAAAESAINLAILISLTPRTNGRAPFPLYCRMPGGEQVAITVSEESGKVDLNAGSAQTLTKLFVALAGDRVLGERIAAAILAFRDPRQGQPAAAAAQPQARGFRSILELDRVPGITPDLLRNALPFVTVRSGRMEPDAGRASPALRDILQLHDSGPAQSQGGDDITIRADATVGANGRFVREALVSPRMENGRPFVIREWRRADVDTPASIYDQSSMRPCLVMMKARS
jgi:general secretion pathway protein K